jgi:hypothetical protein
MKDRKHKGAAVEVKEPVATLNLPDKTGKIVQTVKLYILRDKSEKFRYTGVKESSSRAWMYGPAMIEVKHGVGTTTTTELWPEDKETWQWIEAVMNIGLAAVDNEAAEAALPKELFEFFKR